MNLPEPPQPPPPSLPPSGRIPRDLAEPSVRALYEQQLALRDEMLRLREEQMALREEVKKKPADPKDKDGKGEDDADKGDEKDGKKGEKDEDGKGKEDGKDDEEKKDKRPFPQKVREGIKAHPIRTAIILGVLALLVIGGIVLVHWLGTFEDTDDAQIDGDLSAISPRVSGTVTGVYVQDNQVVHAGDLLAEMDVPDFQVALAQAQAALAQARASAEAETPNVPITNVTNRTNIQTSGGDYASASSEAAAADRDYQVSLAREREMEADYQNALLEQQRSQRLVQSGSVSPQDYDNKTTAAAKALAALDGARASTQATIQRMNEARAKAGEAASRQAEAKENAPRNLQIQEATDKARQAAVVAAQAQVDQAELNLKYTKIYAPVSGIVGKKSVNVGDRVSPGQQLFAIVQTDHLWVTADFRETQLQHMHPGQRVKIHVDAIDADFAGTVESMPGATGAKYSLLPPENATGNYVKVVQRLPVRVHVADNQAGYDRLRPGMSVEPTVYLN